MGFVVISDAGESAKNYQLDCGWGDVLSPRHTSSETPGNSRLHGSRLFSSALVSLIPMDKTVDLTFEIFVLNVPQQTLKVILALRLHFAQGVDEELTETHVIARTVLECFDKRFQIYRSPLVSHTPSLLMFAKTNLNGALRLNEGLPSARLGVYPKLMACP
jgi:hypothetical protein